MYKQNRALPINVPKIDHWRTQTFSWDYRTEKIIGLPQYFSWKHLSSPAIQALEHHLNTLTASTTLTRPLHTLMASATLARPLHTLTASIGTLTIPNGTFTVSTSQVHFRGLFVDFHGLYNNLKATLHSLSQSPQALSQPVIVHIRLLRALSYNFRTLLRLLHQSLCLNWHSQDFYFHSHDLHDLSSTLRKL